MLLRLKLLRLTLSLPLGSPALLLVPISEISKNSLRRTITNCNIKDVELSEGSDEIFFESESTEAGLSLNSMESESDGIMTESIPWSEQDSVQN